MSGVKTHGKTLLAIMQHNLVGKRSAEKIHFDAFFSVDVKHVLKLRINKDEVILHPKFASRRPAFSFQNSFSGPKLTCQV